MVIRLDNNARDWQGGNEEEHERISFYQGMRKKDVGFTDVDCVVMSGLVPRMLLEVTKYKFVGTEGEMQHMFAMIDERLSATHSEQSSLVLAQKLGVDAGVLVYLEDCDDNDASLLQFRSYTGDRTWKRDIPAGRMYEFLHKLSRG